MSYIFFGPSSVVAGIIHTAPTYARFLSFFTLASPGTKIHVENLLSKNVCVDFSFSRMIELALQIE